MLRLRPLLSISPLRTPHGHSRWQREVALPCSSPHPVSGNPCWAPLCSLHRGLAGASCPPVPWRSHLQGTLLGLETALEGAVLHSWRGAGLGLTGGCRP